MASTTGPAVIVGPPQQRASNRAPAPRKRKRTLALVACGVVLVVVATVVAVVATRSSPASYRPVAFRVPVAYTVRYAVTTAGSTPSTEILSIRRPFDDADVTYAGTQASGTPNLTIVDRLGVQILKAGNGEGSEFRVPAMPAPLDVRADIVVPAGIKAGGLKPKGSRVVLGHRCQVFRSARSLRSGPLLPMTSKSTYVDSCIDADGIMLRETSVKKSHVVSDHVAVAVSVGAGVADQAPFDLPAAVTPFESGGGAFRALTLDSRPPGSSWALATAPSGYQHLGRFAAVPPQPQLFAGGGQGTGTMGALPGGLVTEMDDVYTRGTDAIVLQQGATINGAAFKPPANAISVDLGRLGRGQLLIAGNVTSIVAEPGNGKQFVRLSATLPPDTVISLMRSLVAQPGGTLTRLPGGRS